MAERIDFNLDQGSTWNQVLQYNDPDGNPIDLTGSTVNLYFNNQAYVLPCDSTGSITIHIQDTSNWCTGIYKIELTDTATDVTRLMQGQISVD